MSHTGSGVYVDGPYGTQSAVNAFFWSMHFSSMVKLGLFPGDSRLLLAVTSLSITAASLSLISGREYSETSEKSNLWESQMPVF